MSGRDDTALRVGIEATSTPPAGDQSHRAEPQPDKAPTLPDVTPPGAINKGA
jgi:hypothetical protein